MRTGVPSNIGMVSVSMVGPHLGQLLTLILFPPSGRRVSRHGDARRATQGVTRGPATDPAADPHMDSIQNRVVTPRRAPSGKFNTIPGVKLFWVFRARRDVTGGVGDSPSWHSHEHPDHRQADPHRHGPGCVNRHDWHHPDTVTMHPPQPGSRAPSTSPSARPGDATQHPQTRHDGTPR